MPESTPRQVIYQALQPSLVDANYPTADVLDALDEAGYAILMVASYDRVEAAARAVLKANYAANGGWDEETDKLVREDMRIGLAAADAGRVVIDPDDEALVGRIGCAIQTMLDEYPLVPRAADGGIDPYELAGAVLAELKEWSR